MNALLGPYKYVIDAIVIALLVGGISFGVHKYNEHQQGIGEARIQAKWDAEKKQIDDQSKALKETNAAKEKALQATADTIKRQANEQIANLSRNLDSAIAGLRERPSRDSAGNLPRDAGTGSTIGATGADLSRQDAAFSLREAARADKLRLQLARCQAQYSAARDKVR